MGKRRDSWIIDKQDYETEEAFRAAVADELARFEHIGFRQGFGIVAAPIRQRFNGFIETLGWEFRAERIPLVRDVGQADPLPDAPEPEPDEEDEEPATEPVVDHTDGRLDGEPAEEIPEPAAVGSEKDPYA